MAMEQNPRTPAQSLRRHVSRWVVASQLSAALLVTAATRATAQHQLGTVSNTAGTLSVKVESLFDGVPPHGFLPLRITIQNDTSRAVSLGFATSSSDNQYYRGENSTEATFRLNAEAGQTAEHEILAPVVSSYSSSSGYRYGGSGTSLSVKISGGGLPERQVAEHSDLMDHLPCVALSTESHRLNWEDVKNQLEAAAPGGSSHGGGTFGARFAPERLPAHWRGLSGFDVLVFRGDEWGKVAPTARAAVLDWVRMGGRLLFWGDDEKTPELADLGFASDGEGKAALDLGLGTVAATAGKQKASGSNLIDARKLLGSRKNAQGHIRAISNDYQKDSGGNPWALQQALGIRTFNSGQIVFILIAFGVIVGPVNLFMLAKPGRRHRLFITTPIISVVASVLIAALIFIQDGFGGKGLRSSVTFLDPGARKSYATQEQIARTGVLLGRSFTAEEPLVVTPVALGESRWTFVHDDGNRGNSLGYELAGKTFSGDWFRSRSEQGHLVRTVLPTRESVQVLAAEVGPASEPVVLSTIAYPLARLVYVDDTGAVWKGENISTGEKATLTPWDSSSFIVWWKESLKGFGESVRSSVAAASTAKLHGRFYAIASEKAKPPMIDTLASIKWKDTQALVFGIAETIGKGGPPAP